MAGRLTAFINVSAILLTAGLPSMAPLRAAPVRTQRAACHRAKTRVSAVRHFPASVVAFCDPIRAADSPRDFYVLALHSNRHCDDICSTNMGWFAVEKRTGRVFEWDMAEDKLGEPVSAHR